MTRKRRRLYALGAGMLALFVAAGLALSAFEDTLVFFYSPSDIIADRPPAGRAIRLGGLVEEGSLEQRAGGTEIRFRVTDLARTITVTYSGILPDLFREGQGVVAEGSLDGDGVFQARQVLAKHDENYMPPEVADALKKSGHWRESGDSQ